MMSSSSSSSSALNASIDKPGSVGKWGLSGLRSIESNLEESNLEEPSGPCPGPNPGRFPFAAAGERADVGAGRYQTQAPWQPGKA